jgi:cytochrome oxidase Cu insertion factor (SCO1/SenC/PrrC family)
MKNQALQIDSRENIHNRGDEEVLRLAEDKTALVKYEPISKASYVMDTLIPKNMSYEVKDSLGVITNKHGNIDNYVRDGLKYRTTAALWSVLSAEQIDSLGLYLHQFDKEQGIIIADQTGIGKGRQAAAVIRHAVMQGYLPVFFTKSPNLFTDMYRDLKAIDFENINPFIVNNSSDAQIKDANGLTMFSPLSSAEQEALLTEIEEFPTDSPEAIKWYKRTGRTMPDPEKVPITKIYNTLDRMPLGYDMIFCTYSQIQSANPYKRFWLEKLIENGIEGSKVFKKVVFILDESHMAGGYDSIIGKWMREMLPKIKACCYLSATFAKYPEVMPFYGKKTAIMETGLSDSEFVRAMKSGGLALQEIVASNLCESGQLIRRQRSSEGIKIDYKILNKEPERSKNRASVNRIISLMNEVVQFEADYIAPILAEIHERAKEEAGSMKKPPRALGVKQAPYFSRVFNVVDQMLFALKVEQVAKETLDLLLENKKVVIAFKSTMGTFLKDLKMQNGDMLPLQTLDFTRTLVKGLDSVFYYNYTTFLNEKTRERIPLEDLPYNGIQKYKEIRKKMRLESTGLSISPIDKLIHLIEKQKKPTHLGGHKNKHFTIAEVTGRSQRIDFSNEQYGVIESQRKNTEKAFREFNSGKIDVLLINQSGSTGASAHSSKDFLDQRQRVMIIHQVELNINTEVQKRGRINRTGQVNLPEYLYITSDIPTEKRMMAMLKGKMKSLDANTTGSQNTNDETLDSPDFFNKYGDVVAWQWINENQEKMEILGYPTYRYERVKKERVRVRKDSKEGAMRQLTGRAGLLQVEDQERLYTDLLERYENQIKLEKQNGTYDLEAEFLRLDADVKKRYLYAKGNGGVTPFGRDCVRDETIINNLRRPYTRKEVDKRIFERLQGEKPIQVRKTFENKLQEEYPKIIEKRKEKRLETITGLKADRDALPKLGSGENAEANEKIKSDLEKIEQLISQKTSDLALDMAGFEATQTKILDYVSMWDIGDVVKVPFVGSSLESSWGIYVGFTIGGKKTNPYTLSNISLQFLVTDSRRQVTYNLQPAEQAYISQIFTESNKITDADKEMVALQWNELIKKASKKRERRHILTENIVKVSFHIGSKNKLIKYNTKDNQIKSGILMNREFGNEGEQHGALYPISHAYITVSGLEQEAIFEDHKVLIRFKRISEKLFEVYISKRGLWKASVDEKLRVLLYRENNEQTDSLPEFVQNAGEMTARLHHDNLEAFLKRLDHYKLRFLGEAKQLEDWEIENEEDWQSRSQNDKGEYKYALGRAYGQGTNPGVGFTNYIEPTTKYPYGVVVYNRALLDKERYNYSLKPIFESLHEPYKVWKNYIVQKESKKLFNDIVRKARKKKLHEAIDLLGNFIIEHLHEQGNPEFVLGDYTIAKLGRIFYEDMIAKISTIEELISQLQIALEK